MNGEADAARIQLPLYSSRREAQSSPAKAPVGGLLRPGIAAPSVRARVTRTYRRNEIDVRRLAEQVCVKNDFDVHKWTAPEFLEQAARELLEEEWKKKTTEKLPKTAEPLASGGRLG